MYSVDKIENEIVIIEDIETGEIINVNLKLLPKEVKENDILKFDGNIYSIDLKEKEKRINRIREKMNKLKK